MSNLASQKLSKFNERRKENIRQRDGTVVGDPFVQLTDALTKAKELAAKYKNNIHVNIHMFRGSHFVVFDRGDAYNIYMQKYKDSYL